MRLMLISIVIEKIPTRVVKTHEPKLTISWLFIALVKSEDVGPFPSCLIGCRECANTNGGGDLILDISTQIIP